MLNLPGFIKEVDTITHTLNKAELEEFIHEVARTLPEVKREDFLMKLKLRQIKEAKSGLREQEDHNIREIYQCDLLEYLSQRAVISEVFCDGVG